MEDAPPVDVKGIEEFVLIRTGGNDWELISVDFEHFDEVSFIFLEEGVELRVIDIDELDGDGCKFIIEDVELGGAWEFLDEIKGLVGALVKMIKVLKIIIVDLNFAISVD